jgi:hypothetical protein
MVSLCAATAPSYLPGGLRHGPIAIAQYLVAGVYRKVDEHGNVVLRACKRRHTDADVKRPSNALGQFGFPQSPSLK